MDFAHAYSSFVEDLEIPVLQTPSVLGYVADNIHLPEGLILEFGVFRGESISLLAQKFPNKTIYGFDSFEGLPEDWRRPDQGFSKAFFNMDRTPPVLPYKNIDFQVGWFDKTLPLFLESHPEKASLIHIDSDIYSSCRYILTTMKHRLQPGTVIVFDELINYPSYEYHEMKAFFEFLMENPSMKVEIIGGRGVFRKICIEDLGGDQAVAIRIHSI